MNPKKRPKTVVVCLMLSVLLVLPAWAFSQQEPGRPPVPPPAKPGPVWPGEMDVRYEKGLLSVKAKDADLETLLKEIGKLAGIPVEVGSGVSGRVTLSFAGSKPDEGIDRILGVTGEKNLATEYTKTPGAKKDEFKITKIVVLRKAPAKSGKESDEEAMARIRKRDQEYRDFFEEMDKKKNKLARTLKEYVDPETSPERRIKLKTYLRQTSVDDPEDKKVLKAALLDASFKGEIVSDMQMALLHSIQDKPEESDKEFILALLGRNDNRVGWLYYAMLNAWDERYVPYLLEAAKNKPRSRLNIEILGRAKVKEAVPILEEILRDKKEKEQVRDAALIALRKITGEKYPIERVPKTPTVQGE